MLRLQCCRRLLVGHSLQVFALRNTLTPSNIEPGGGGARRHSVNGSFSEARMLKVNQMLGMCTVLEADWSTPSSTEVHRSKS